MTFEEIQESWSKDCQIDVLNISGESANTPKLHHKYLLLLVRAKGDLRKAHTRLAKLKALKHDYFMGIMTKEDLDRLGWEPFQLKILKADMSKYIDRDKDVITVTTSIGEAQEIVFYLEEVLRQINARGFQIKSVIDWERFQHGG